MARFRGLWRLVLGVAFFVYGLVAGLIARHVDLGPITRAPVEGQPALLIGVEFVFVGAVLIWRGWKAFRA